MKITVLGAGSAFTLDNDNFQSNFLIEFDNGYRLLFDCGGDIRWALLKAGYTFKDINGVYISHLHADHIGGLEWLALKRYFGKIKPDLLISESLVGALWSDSLRGGLSTLQNAHNDLNTFFNVIPIKGNEIRDIALTKFHLVQTCHFMDGYIINPSFGMMINHVKSGTKIYITSDTQYAPNQIMDFWRSSDVILQDCETTSYQSRIHAHYDELKVLPDEIKSKMWLYHYSDIENPDMTIDVMQQYAHKDKFKGFLTRGQVLEF